MSVSESPQAPAAALTARLPLSLRLAWRDFRGGLSGFAIFIACIALGVMVITGVGALSDTLRSGLQDQGRQLIGGDISIARMHTALSREKMGALREFAAVTETATMRTMARKPDGSDQMLAELKAVDDAYPLVGQVQLKSGGKLSEAIGEPGNAVVDEILLERLGLKVGDRFTLGTGQIEIAGIITNEPDGLGDRLTFGPRIMMSRETLDATELVKPGTLIRWRYALALPGGGSLDATGLEDARDELKDKLSDQGFTILDRRDPSPQIRRTLDRLRQFLTLVGLTALLVGGVGVANAVAAFIDKRRKSIATMKSLGASNRTVLSIYLSQILLVTTLGIAIGLGSGLMIPWVINAFLGHLLPFPATVTVSAFSIALACAYGLLVALVFALWPLGRAERVTAAVLFRDDVEESRAWPYRHIIIATLLVGAALVALAILSSDARKVAIAFTVAVTIIFALFIGLGWLVTRVARRIPRPSIPELALALGNIGSPGGLTRSVVLSLGAGLSLLMAVALADSSIVKELEGRLPENAPDYFVVDIPRSEIARFRETVAATVPDTQVFDAPMLRGRIVALKGTPVEEIKAPPEAAWVLNGDRGITYSDTLPEASTLTSGTWWGKDYSGPPVVSFEAEIGEELGLEIGDEITVNVLGREITAKIANFRRVEWESLAINFVMVFSPNTLRGAPTNALATVTMPKDVRLAKEAELSRAITREFPTTTAVRVRDAIDSFNEIFGKVMLAVRIAGSVTLVAGALVLAGALATAQRRRIMETVILKAIGATQRRILTAHLLEYGLLALLTAFFAIGLGALAAWATLTYIMDVPFTFSWIAVTQALTLSLGLVLLFGGLGTWQALRARPVPYLRSD